MATYMPHFMGLRKSPSCPHTRYYYGKSSLSAASPHPYIDADSIGDPTVPPIIPLSQWAGKIAVYRYGPVLGVAKPTAAIQNCSNFFSLNVRYRVRLVR